MCGARAVTNMSEPCSSAAMRSRLGSIPRAQCSSKLAMPSASRRTLCRKLCAMSGLNTLSSRGPWEPPKLMATSFPMTWHETMVSASHCVGFTLPGMIELPGSFSGIESSPMPQRGPLASRRISLAIFMSAAASALRAPCACTIASCAARASNLLGAVTKAQPVRRESSAAARAPNSGCALSPVPPAVPPSASSDKGDDRGHVHRGRKYVVRGLAAIHVVVRVDRPALPAGAAEKLARTIREHLVHVHVGLRARSGLPDHEWKLVGPAPRKHFVGGRCDGLGLFRC